GGAAPPGSVTGTIFDDLAQSSLVAPMSCRMYALVRPTTTRPGLATGTKTTAPVPCASAVRSTHDTPGPLPPWITAAQPESGDIARSKAPGLSGAAVVPMRRCVLVDSRYNVSPPTATIVAPSGVVSTATGLAGRSMAVVYVCPSSSVLSNACSLLAPATEVKGGGGGVVT